MPVERDPREWHDQIIDHNLNGKSEAQLLAILIIELRRLRVQLEPIADYVRRRTG